MDKDINKLTNRLKRSRIDQDVYVPNKRNKHNNYIISSKFITLIMKYLDIKTVLKFRLINSKYLNKVYLHCVFEKIVNRYNYTLIFKNIIKRCRFIIDDPRRFTNENLKSISHNIVSINLCCNNIITSNTVKRLKNLEYLNLESNDIITESSINNLYKLKWITLRDNILITNIDFIRRPMTVIL